MKKVLHLGKYYPPDFGGIEKITSLIVDNDSKNNHKVVCFSKQKKFCYQNQKSKKIYRFYQYFKIFSQPINIQYILFSIREMNNNDIAHIHLPNIFALISACFIKKPIVIHWHSDIIKNKLLYSIVKPLEHFVLKKSKFIIISTNNYLEHSEPLTNFYDKVKVIPYGISRPKKQDISKLPSDLMTILKKKKIILSVGRLVKYKGYSDLIEAMSSINATLVLIGDGPEYNNLIKIININKLKDKVFILRELSDEDKDRVYSMASIFCLPSLDKSESYGMSIVEAMSFGLPLVTTNLADSGITWLNQHDKTGICVEPNSPNQLNQSIIKILRSNLLYKKYSENSKTRFEQELQINSFIERLNSIYNQL